MKKHLADTANYHDFVCFISPDLGDPILLEYLKYNDYKSALFISANSITKFIEVICDWMHAETMSQLKGCGHITLLLNEMTDISIQSELLLTDRIFKDEVVKNLYLDLLQLICCDSATIFKSWKMKVLA